MPELNLQLLYELRALLEQIVEDVSAREALIAKLKQNPKVHNPEALATWIGRQAGRGRIKPEKRKARCGPRHKRPTKANTKTKVSDTAKAQERANAIAEKARKDGKSWKDAQAEITKAVKKDAAEQFLKPDDAPSPVSAEGLAGAAASALPDDIKDKIDTEKLAEQEAVQDISEELSKTLEEQDVDEMIDSLAEIAEGLDEKKGAAFSTALVKSGGPRKSRKFGLRAVFQLLMAVRAKAIRAAQAATKTTKAVLPAAKNVFLGKWPT